MMNMTSTRSRHIRPMVATLLLLSATAFFVAFVDQQYPLKHWLFFRYVGVWAYCALFSVACLAAGWSLISYFLPTSVSLTERMVVAASLGVLTFFGGVFVAGLLDLYGTVFFFGWPLLLFLVGARRLGSDLCTAWYQHRHAGIRRWMPSNARQLVAALFLLLGVVAVYLQVMTPLNLCADSYWYHLPMAEYYSHAGGIRRFDEGWYLGAYPQLATFLYTWAFQAPGKLFDHVLTCTHLEFVLFLSTLAGISVLSGRLLGRRSLAWAAAAVFLFPKIFVYDSNLNGGADHILAFWAPALGLVLIRLASQFDVRQAALAGLITAGAVLTKYQASILVVPASMLVLLLAVRWRRIVPPVVWGLVCLAATAPHWLKNLVYYQDPFYPLLHGIFPSTPFHPEAASVLENVFWPKQFMPHGPIEERLIETAKVLATFSFIPNDWDFHGSWPVFGSTFTLLVPVLLFLRAPRRLWFTVIGVHVGLAVWYLTVHEDRFLQALLPWMASSTAAGIALAWRQPATVRLATGALVAVQVVWGADAYFIRSHAMVGDSPVRALGDYLGSAQKHRYVERYQFPADFEKLGAVLPSQAKALVHQYNTRLGLGTEYVTDSTGWQGGIEYLFSNSPRAASGLWQTYGVTHVLWLKPRNVQGSDELAREAVFARTIDQYVDVSTHVDAWQIGGFRSSPKDEALAAEPTLIAFLGCNGRPESGVYSPREFAREQPHQRLSKESVLREGVELFKEANAILIKSNCGQHDQVEARIGQEFAQVLETNEIHIWVRVSRP